MTVTEGYRWSVTYQGDEPINHPFYVGILRAVVGPYTTMWNRGLVCEITYQTSCVPNVETRITCIPREYVETEGELRVELCDTDGEPTGEMLTIEAYTLLHISIC